jgi:hypothetical protein
MLREKTRLIDKKGLDTGPTVWYINRAPVERGTECDEDDRKNFYI